MTDTLNLSSRSPFALVRIPNSFELGPEGPVRSMLMHGRQDDGIWGPVGALWLSEDGERGGFLVHPWALWEGSEFVRGYRSAQQRGWTPATIYRYWREEVWRGTYAADDEVVSETLLLLNELLSTL
ncbi:MAG: hypothetical protein ACXWX9_03165 [Actinomycetota bacterium]